MLFVVGQARGLAGWDAKDITVKASGTRRIEGYYGQGPRGRAWAVRRVRLDTGAESTLRRQRSLREGGKLHYEYQVATTPRHRDIMMSDRAALIRLFHVLLPGLVILQAALCAAQCSFWHALLQYSTLLHALHWLRPSFEQPGHAQWRRSLAPDAPSLEPDEAALVVAPLSAEQREDVTGCD